ncbi:hypothetical protein ISCGN_015218 [Ixodes scapularis]
MVKTLAGRPLPRQPIHALALARGATVQQVTELLADLFTNVPTRLLVGPAPQHWSTRRDPSAPSMKAMDAPFTLHELRHATDACPRQSSSPGPDGVTNQAIRNLDESCHDSLLDYMNKVWSSAEIPRARREATTIRLLKSGRPADDLSSYRPISLTSCFGKLLERMVLPRLNYHLEAVDALPDCFSGFRRQRSTADSIADLTTTMEEAKERGW